MRSVGFALFLYSSVAIAQTSETQAGGRVLNGHKFMYPATFDSALVETTFGTRTMVRTENVNDVPVGTFRVDVSSLGVRETAGLEVAFGECWSVGLAGFGQFVAGTSARGLATQGAIYAYGGLLSGALRVARIESSGTQISVRVQGFGIQGGARFTLLPLLVIARNDPRSLPELIVNVGDVSTTPTSWYGFAGGVQLAQAITPALSMQAAFRLEIRRFRQSPFIPGRGRVDVDSTGVLPVVGAAFGVSPPDFPISFLAEYRAAAQDDDDPTSLAHHTVAVGGYYSARPDLQLGPVLFGEFGLPEIHGFDNAGNVLGSDRGTAFAGQLMMQYIW
jgi:hypothetical protein